jgi:hypothetical protein
MINIVKITITGLISIPPIGGIILRIGAKIGSVTL